MDARTASAISPKFCTAEGQRPSRCLGLPQAVSPGCQAALSCGPDSVLHDGQLLRCRRVGEETGRSGTGFVQPLGPAGRGGIA